MKSKGIAIALLAATAAIGYSSTSFAEMCYGVDGSLTTENVTDSIQIGNINLTLTDTSGSQVFSETGSLVGNITGATATGATFLYHQARFPQGNSFRTEGDVAQIVGYPLAFEEDGTPCAFPILEKITEISKGTGMFKNVTHIEVTAQGTVSACSFNNENSFELVGRLCVE